MGSDNKGFFVFRPAERPQDDAFYLVLGSPRGGTTLVAHSLASLGVFMGEKLPFTVEDQLLTVMAERGDFDSVRRKLAARSSMWWRHGWKLPQLLYYCEQWDFLPANTRLILIYRDPVATAVRGHLATEHAMENELHTAMEYHRRMFALAQSTAWPTLFVSYEKALLQAEAVVDGLSDFIGGATDEQKARAVARIQPSPDTYQKRDSEKKRNALRGSLAGCIDFLEPGRASGWALDRENPRRRVTVEFELPGGAKVAAVANRLRVDMKQSGRHPTGHCGYQVDFSKVCELVPGEQVHARDQETGAEFDGSPFVYSDSLPAIGHMESEPERESVPDGG